MGMKEKLIGLILVVLGVWPFVLKVEAIKTFFSQYKFLEVLTPGEIVYQVVVVLLGVLLILKLQARVEQRR